MARRILVVDDDDLARSYEHSVLERHGYTVVSATDGREALGVLKRQAPFDLFVVDVVMPQMSGTELARHIRQDIPDAKILYVTGFADRLFADKRALWEGEAFIEKPSSPRGLLEAVALLLYGTTEPPPGGDTIQ
jgi:two-component system cell cycle sensor histidine kinase/response regulator CckA